MQQCFESRLSQRSKQSGHSSTRKVESVRTNPVCNNRSRTLQGLLTTRCKIMKRRTNIFLALAAAAFAQDRPKDAPQSPIVMPEVKVHGPRFETFTLAPSQDREGNFSLLIIPHPGKVNFFTLLVAGAQLGDLVVAIENSHARVEVKSLNRSTWNKALDHGDFRLVVQRRVGRRSYRIVELDARRIRT